MPDDGQEHVEDYLELEHFLSEMQAGRVARLPLDLTPSQARLYRIAILFLAAAPDGGQLQPEFVSYLYTRLEAELQALRDGRRPRHASRRSGLRTRRISRRILLAESSLVAASVAVGAGVEHMIGKAEQTNTSGGRHINGSPLDWFFVTTVANLGNQAIEFHAQNLVGYVVRSSSRSGDPVESGTILALAAVCTHKGCIVQWSNTDRLFYCPCHGAVFTEDGEVHTGTPTLRPLPRLEVKVEADEKIYVRMSTSL